MSFTLIKNIASKGFDSLTVKEFNHFMRNLKQPENQFEIKKKSKMSKEMPSLTEEEYAGFMASMKRMEARDKEKQATSPATGDVLIKLHRQTAQSPESKKSQQDSEIMFFLDIKVLSFTVNALNIKKS